MTHAPIDGRFWCKDQGDHRWLSGHNHQAPCCRHSGHAEAAQGAAPPNPLTYNNPGAERHVPFDEGAAPRAEGLDVAERIVRGFVGLFDNMSAPDLYLMGMRHDSAILVEAREWLARLSGDKGADHD